MWFLNATRVLALISIGVAGGLMLRFYISQTKMPWGGFLGWLGYAVAAGGGLVINISRGGEFKWWITPFVLLGSIAIIMGVTPQLRWRRGQVPGDKSDYTGDARLWRGRNQGRRSGDG